MGTKVHYKSYMPGDYSMRDLNEDCSSSNWPLFYGDRSLANGQYYNGFFPRTVANAYPGHDKDAVKQTMLEHEKIFKHQVYELHRLYKVQKDMMGEIRRMELHKHRIPMETSSSSSPLVSQMPSEEARKWHKPTFPLVTSVCARSSVSGAEIISSPLSFTEGNGRLAGPVPFQNGSSLKDCEILESRPSKVRKKLFDLELPAGEYIDTEEEDKSLDNKMSGILSYPPSINHKIACQNSLKFNLGDSAKIDCDRDASRSGSCLRSFVGLADLNEPLNLEESPLPTSLDFAGRAMGHGEIKDPDLAVKHKSQSLLGLHKDILQDSQHGSRDGSSSSRCIQNMLNKREWLSYMYEAGDGKSHLSSSPQGLPPDKLLMSSQLTHPMLYKAHQPSGIVPSDHRRGDLRTERTVRGFELAERSRDISSLNHLEPVVASQIQNPYPLVHSSNLESAWSHSIPSWGKPSGSFIQKLTATQPHPPLNSLGFLSMTSQSSAQSHEIFGEKWLFHNSSGSKPDIGNCLPNHNGFYYGSSSGSKDAHTHFPSVGFGYLNSNKDDKVASERSINYGPGSFLKGPNFMDKMSSKDLNLNTVLSKCSSNEVVPQRGLQSIDDERKCEDHLKVLPWLKAKPACKNEDTSTRRDSISSGLSFLQSVSNQKSMNADIVNGSSQIFIQNIALASCDHETGAKRNELGDCSANRKILGVPIFDKSCAPKYESSSLISTSASLRCISQHEGTKDKCKIGVIDINLACDPESETEIAEVVVLEKERGKRFAGFRTQIDLNSCVSSDEEFTVAPSVESTSVKVKIAVEIDLEAPAFPESEEDIPPAEELRQHVMSVKSPEHMAELPRDEAARIAAEAIVSISSCVHLKDVEGTTFDRVHLKDVEGTTFDPPEAPAADSLLWFVEVVSSHANDGKLSAESKGKSGGDNGISSFEEIDYFEAMTLQLPELKEEEYMPKPVVSENQNVEETGAISLANRPRKGQARRGRPRRDFQRDILPGLASLSRHEVTEDLQTFGGLMRATGHQWHSGLNRRNGTRNGGARGRRRAVVDPSPVVEATTVCTTLIQQLNNIEVGLEDRNLTGWGKTPRRPRRQRCPPAGNPSSILST